MMREVNNPRSKDVVPLEGFEVTKVPKVVVSLCSIFFIKIK